MELIRKTPPKVLRLPQGTFQMDLRGVKFAAIRDTHYQGRQRVNFDVKTVALEEAAKVEELLKQHGQQRLQSLSELPNYDLITQSIERLKPFGKTLIDAVEYYLQHLTNHKAANESRLVSELVQEWFNEKKESKINPIRKRTLDTLATYRNIIREQFGAKRIKQLTKDEINEWLNGLNKTPRTIHHHLNHLNQFLNWCYKKEYLEKLPTVGISVDVPESHPEFFTVDQIKTILETLQNPIWEVLLPYHLICLYAGIRPQEASLLTWEHVETDYIRVPANVSKTKRERLVKMEPNLKEWMTVCRKKFPTLIPDLDIGDKTKRFHNALPFEWIPDGCRHSFATYYISKYREGGYGRLETMMGSSAYVLRRHYVRFVPDEEFNAFWGLTPTVS